MRITSFTILLLFTVFGFAQTDSIIVKFEKNSSYLSTQEKSKLNIYDDILKIEIVAYCDFLGSKDYNLWLSEKRALRVKSILKSRGLNIELIKTTIGKGEIKREVENNMGYPDDRKAIVYIWQKEEPKIVALPAAVEKTEILSEPKAKPEIPELDSIKVGESIKLPRLSFIPGQHNLSPGSEKSLNVIFDFLVNNQNAVVSIEGHICCETQYDDGYDQETGLYNLSTARAKVIFDYLVSEGINPDRLSYKGYGRTRPLFPNESNTLEQQGNRRVEFKLVDK